ncbi:MAG: phosphoribosylglycinamide formyltransferase [Bacteroidetes bacterium]|nr:phosphoribosylglycinamide formyltransferase [Bacteroidota bacterium]NCQ11171.1 phosphoribosylglycinamide formyltransferase [Bacteroidota bacterium]
MSKKKIVVLASGSGSNFQSIINSVDAGEINAEISGFITNNPSASSIERAKRAGISALVIAEKYFSTYDEYVESLLKHLALFEAELIVLAGYMRKIPISIISKYEGNILNIHPSLLPKFGGKGMFGMHVHRAVIEAGEKESGCTVHLVTQEYDEGPILAQAIVPVLAEDTAEELQKRVLKEEHRLYPEVLKKLCSNASSN